MRKCGERHHKGLLYFVSQHIDQTNEEEKVPSKTELYASPELLNIDWPLAN